MRPPAKNMPDAVVRVAELEAQLAANEQELRESKARYDELRHRIKNDLQGLTLLLSMQAKVSSQPDYCGRCVSRLSSAAALHSTLDNDGSDMISMPSYLTALSDTIKKSFGDWIAFETVIEPSIKLDHRRAQFVGLIYAEAAMNTVKYAFPNDAAGKMEVRFRRLNGTFEMTVSDNGVGFDPATTPPGRGTKLMQEIAQQLQGTLRLERLPIGMAVRLTFADLV